jgi:hypothetical protein
MHHGPLMRHQFPLHGLHEVNTLLMHRPFRDGTGMLCAFPELHVSSEIYVHMRKPVVRLWKQFASRFTVEHPMEAGFAKLPPWCIQTYAHAHGYRSFSYIGIAYKTRLHPETYYLRQIAPPRA